MNTNYQIEELSSKIEGFKLTSPQGHAVCIAPLAGFNAYSFRVPIEHGELRVLDEPTEEALKTGSFSYGYPILFPFANRIRDGIYVFEGRTYQLDVNFDDGNAIHGLVYNREWKIVGQGADEESAWLSAQFDTRQDADVFRQYPFETVFTATWRLKDASLILETHIENVGDSNMPMSYGVHPWFPLPLTTRGQRESCVLNLPASARWELEGDGQDPNAQLIPTGKITPVSETDDFRDGKSIGTQFLDAVFTDLQFSGDEHICSVVDPGSELKLTMKSSPQSAWREFVIYAPLNRNIICLEPYSGTTDAPNLHNAGIDAGLVILEPSEIWLSKISIEIELL